MNPATPIINMLRHPLKFRMYLLFRLPSAFFSGVRVREINDVHCAVTIPYKWFTKNPFRSVYFACLGMAAEMSTGILCLAHLYDRKPAVSMLVIKAEAEFFKKATGITTFICEDGMEISEAIEKAIKTYEPVTVRVRSTGKNEGGIVVAEFYITWSFKAKTKY